MSHNCNVIKGLFLEINGIYKYISWAAVINCLYYVLKFHDCGLFEDPKMVVFFSCYVMTHVQHSTLSVNLSCYNELGCVN